MTKSNSEKHLLSQAEFARRIGVSRQRIGTAISSGRLSTSLVWQGNRVGIDAEVGREEWDSTIDRSRAPGYIKARADAPRPAPVEQEHFSLAIESAREKHYKANLAQLEYEAKEGKLVDADEAREVVIKVFTEVKNKLLGCPHRLKQRHPSLDLAVIKTLDEIIREALEALAEGDGE